MLKKNKTKRKIYIRTFSALMAVYLVLMAGFSLFMLMQQRKVFGLQYGTRASYINSMAERILKDNTDDNFQITDMSRINKEFFERFYSYPKSGIEIAVYTRDYNLIFNTSDDWVCSYTERREGNKSYNGYAYLNPDKWFDTKEAEELKSYLFAKTGAKEQGDIASYSLNLEGFWVDNTELIPEKIRIIPMYASGFDENGNVSSSSGSQENNRIFTTGYKNTENLPYYKYGLVLPGYEVNKDQTQLRNMVTDKEKLERSVKQMNLVSYERVNPVTYRLYVPMPYENAVKTLDMDSQTFYSEFWTVSAIQVNLLTQCIGTLIFVWSSCFTVFVLAAFILAGQTCKIYKEKEEFDQYRIETTNALAHDLKTPLSIISGYAQNLLENVHTEKRDYYAGNINMNVNRMDRIIREMLELSRFEADFFQPVYEEVSLGEVCEKLLHRYGEICSEKFLSAGLEGDATIKADFSLMERVIDNFFVNALDHIPDGGTIYIKISGNTLEFFNSGSHIPEDIINEIWKPYKKADAARSNTKGTGLGLSIAGKILDLYQFSYGAENVDNGVIFRFKW